MLYDTMQRPPRPGSLLELLFTMVQMRRESARLMETRAIITALRDESESGETVTKAYDDYRRALMPYLAQEEQESAQKLRDVLRREFEAGPMKIKPIQANTVVRSRLRNIANKVREASSESGWRMR